ncbi:hypothetical protein CARUB_v10016356mg, partial [Capsella rubella]
MYLPEELVVEILDKASAASLARLRCVSKRWKALIKDVRLAEKRSHATMIMLIDFKVYLTSVNLHQIDNNMVKVIDQFSLKDPRSKSSKEVKILDILHCDGLLLCTTKDLRLVVWNPYSRETKWIQPRISYKRLDNFALGKTSCNKYKILRMEQFGELVSPYLLESEIYDFTSNSWRDLSETRDWHIPPWMRRIMYVNGNTYWLACSNKDNVVFLQSFDFSTERFRSVSLPGDHHSYTIFSLSVTREEQKLCLLTQQKFQNRSPYINIWIATKIESHGAASWIKFLSIALASIHQPFCVCTTMSFLVDPGNKVLVCRGKNGVSNNFLNILGENKSIQVDHHDAKSLCKLLVNYVPSF